MTQSNKTSPFQGEEVETAYDQWSRTYEAVENATRDLAARVLRNYPLDLRDRNILEIGCGTGFNTGYIADSAKDLLAVDFSAGMLEQARVNISASNVRFVQSDIQRDWPIDSASVDLVVCMLVLEHIASLDHVFQEASRVLRRGGEFFICELHPYRQLQGLQARFTEANSGNVVLVQAFLHDVSDYVNVSIQHGFQIIRLAEWRDAGGEDKDKPPRLLSLHVRSLA
jgi:malonyl-CoA O-methyltransferase